MEQQNKTNEKAGSFSLTIGTLERINNLLIASHEYRIMNNLASWYKALQGLFIEVISLETKTDLNQKEIAELNKIAEELEEEFSKFQMRCFHNDYYDNILSEERINPDYDFPKMLYNFEIKLRNGLSKKGLLIEKSGEKY